MRTLPSAMIQALAPFAPLFSKRVWRHAQVLLAGTIFAPGKRTVTAALRVMILDQSKQFHRRYHRVLDRAKWSGRAAARVLLGLLVGALAPDGSLVVGVDETLEGLPDAFGVRGVVWVGRRRYGVYEGATIDNSTLIRVGTNNGNRSQESRSRDPTHYGYALRDQLPQQPLRA